MLTPRLQSLLDLQLAAPAAPPSGLKHLLPGFEGVEQVDAAWCWAAVAATAYQYYSGAPMTACRWASSVLGTPPCRCCQDPGSCGTAIPIGQALGTMYAAGWNYPIDARAILAEIDAAPVGRPIICGQAAEAHVIVLYGLEDRDGTYFVHWFDPDGGVDHPGDTDLAAFNQDWAVTVLTRDVVTRQGGPPCP